MRRRASREYATYIDSNEFVWGDREVIIEVGEYGSVVKSVVEKPRGKAGRLGEFSLRTDKTYTKLMIERAAKGNG